MIETTNSIRMKLSDYSNRDTKLSREVNDKKYFKLKNGLYENDEKVPGYCLASTLYGPSYLSFDYALAYYDLIPERVVNYTSATFNKKKNKDFSNCFGTYYYRDIPERAFPYGIITVTEKGYRYQIATPEKALCDKLYTIIPMENLVDMYNLLVEDLRIDEEDLLELDIETFEKFSKLYHTRNVTLLVKFLRRLKNGHSNK